MPTTSDKIAARRSALAAEVRGGISAPIMPRLRRLPQLPSLGPLFARLINMTRHSRKGSHPAKKTEAAAVRDGSILHNWFRTFAHCTAAIVGSAWAFVIAVAIVIVWAATGPIFHFSDTWQLVINTGTTIITFLMVFLIQNTQNRDAAAMQLKLNE